MDLAGLMLVLALNVGSSSLKHALIDSDGAQRDQGTARFDSGSEGHAEVLQAALEGLPDRPDAIGHRVVHGGTALTGPRTIDQRVLDEIEAWAPLAPLHNHAALECIAAAQGAFPSLPQVACFDTAFHHGMPAAATTYALPASWRKRFGLRRFGFHGLNVEWCSEQARRQLGSEGSRRLIVAHLGSGSSLTAVLEGRSVDTTMGFTPLEGVPMATRSGSVDPGLLLYLARQGLGVEELDQGLEHESGLLGLSGAADLQDVLTGVDSGDGESVLAFEVLAHRIAAAAAGLTAALGGLDALVFTGGAGENSQQLRQAIVDRLGHLGIDEGSAQVLVVPAAEEQVIARQTREVLGE